MLLRSLVLFLTLFAVGNLARAVSTVDVVDTTLGDRRVVIWQPHEATAPLPLLIFSHGFGGCPRQSVFLTQFLAEQGYFVVAVEHADANCARDHEQEPPEVRFRDADQWNDTTYANRRDDVHAVLAALRESPYAQSIDFDRLGLLGHSLGGYTVVGLAGGWESWRIEGVDAVLALSPYLMPYNTHHTLPRLTAPIMFQGGTDDRWVTPFLKDKPDASYPQANVPKYFVEFAGADHFDWSERGGEFHPVINHYAVAFFDYYLKGSGDWTSLTTATDEVKTLWYATAAGSGDASKPLSRREKRHQRREDRREAIGDALGL